MSTASRTEKATPNRVRKAREKGDFPATKDFIAGAQLMCAVWAGIAFFPSWCAKAQLVIHSAIRQSFLLTQLRPADAVRAVRTGAGALLAPLGLAAAALLAITLGTQLISTGMGVSLAKLVPAPNRFNPASRIRGLWSANGIQLVQAALLAPVLCGLTWMLVQGRLPLILGLPSLQVRSQAREVGQFVSDTMRRAALAVFVMGSGTLLVEKNRYSRKLRMSKQEVKEEHKEAEGNPQAKARIRRAQREMRRHNMMKDVPTATAVIVNPTHFAVALKYEQGTMAAPKVVAKGRNYLAARIRHHAVRNQVPIIENPPLAQALYKTAEIGQEIPVNLYRAVAEILAYIFRVTGRGGSK